MPDDLTTRCLVTGNLVGTDTWEANTPCRCAPCQKFVALRNMPDSLTTRCLAEVERAMAAEPHDSEPALCGALLGDGPCGCTRDRRLAARLARMMAAGIEGGIETTMDGIDMDTQAGRRRGIGAALRAIAQAREAP